MLSIHKYLKKKQLIALLLSYFLQVQWIDIGMLNQNGRAISFSTSQGLTPVIPFVDASTISYDSLRIMAQSGQRLEAIPLAKAYLEKEENADVRVLLGYMLFWNDQYDEARVQFQMVLQQKSKGYSDASEGLIRVEIQTEHYQAALNAVNSALTQDPQNTNFLKIKKNIVEKLNTQSISEVASTPSLGSRLVKSDQGITKNNITYVQLRNMAYSGSSEEAIRLAKIYLKTNDNSDVRVLLARLLIWEKKYGEARLELNKVLKKNPTHLDAISASVDINIRLNQYSIALIEIQKGLQYHPKDAYLLEKKKTVLYRLKKATDSKLNNLTHSVETDPTDTNSESSQTKTDKKKKDAIHFSYDIAHISDLDQTWRENSFSYKHSMDWGSLIFRINQAYRFEEDATQYEIDAYPSLGKGAYLYLNYSYSHDSFYPINRYGIEGFFSLPQAYEFSVGERILQFSGGTTYVHTGSIAKYIGNYWIAYRPYITDGISHHLTVRRYFSSADSYISLYAAYGSAPSDLSDRDSISADRSRSIGLDGQFPVFDDLFFTYSMGYSLEHFPTGTNRTQIDSNIGLTWRP